jgi:hypothetical protein
MAEHELEDIFGGTDETNDARAQRLLNENAPFAAAAVIDVMNSSLNDNTRLRAAQEILARTLGPIGKDDQEGTLDKFIQGLEDMANRSNSLCSQS